jgi:hypothetical protein
LKLTAKMMAAGSPRSQSLPSVMAYGVTEAEARARVTALAREVIAERIAAGEAVPS